jgi:hypothetical protein
MYVWGIWEARLRTMSVEEEAHSHGGRNWRQREVVIGNVLGSMLTDGWHRWQWQ